MGIDLKSSINEIFKSKKDLIALDDLEWDSTLLKCDNALPIYSSRSLRYYSEYFEASHSYKYGILVEGELYAISCFHLTSDNLLTSSNGVILPLFIRDVSDKLKIKIIKEFSKILNELSVLLERKINMYSNIFSSISDYTGLPKIIKNSASVQSTFHWVSNIRPTIEEQKTEFRKSYKSLINKGQRLFDVEKYHGSSEKLSLAFKAFRSLHLREAGKLTRSSKTWDIQLEMIMKKEAVLILSYYENELIGGAIFQVNSLYALYSVAAYRRDLFRLPIGHTIQFEAFKFFINLGVKLYYLGENYNGIDTKQSTISSFKEGFSNSIMLSISF